MEVEILSKADSSQTNLWLNHGYQKHFNHRIFKKSSNWHASCKTVTDRTFAKYYQCDVLHLQEANIDEETFSSCNFLQNSYNIFENNSINKYGTASLVKSELIVDNLRYDSEGRVIIFDIGNLTLGNVYLHSGTDAAARSSRENIVVRCCLTCS